MSHSVPSFEEFKKELEQATRFGFMAVKTTVENSLVRWQNDWVKLAQISDHLICQGNLADRQDDHDLTATYLYLLHMVWEFAIDHLSENEYCEYCNFSPYNQCYDEYSDLAVEIIHLL